MLEFDVLDSKQDVERLVLDPKSDSAVKLFKALQVLRKFSHSVQEAPAYLKELSDCTQNSPGLEIWPNDSKPNERSARKILQHNWDVVNKRQQEAADRVLRKIERTTDEVKSLRDGLFNVQSVREAQKGRILNKYMVVFTVVTIIFLPPTFVSTFFGMQFFQRPDDAGSNRGIYWTVFGIVSGITYVVAACGLFGAAIPAEKRRQVIAWFKKAQDWLQELLFLFEKIYTGLKHLPSHGQEVRQNVGKKVRESYSWVTEKWWRSPEAGVENEAAGA
ncbi:hypothetical protein CDD80_7597 [Ophiocordyceps camponoti-rufipedis]|uniref:Uncharacterized protein n=1 Tax=Ophiocordyceps camponoti-rufipedis TaxID=2004952 RepID=A0A2C5Z7T7_9HYPO|nr:hypothetical protein CDD80_7597 [Ophiocordyceps camponoti-rufipedis]